MPGINQIVRQIHHNYDEPIISFVNNKYLPILNNWVKYIRNLNIDNYVIVPLDLKSYKHNNRKSINTTNVLKLENIYNNKRLCNLWIARITMIKKLLTCGHSLILSDLDAIWLKNPIPHIHGFDADIIGSIVKNGYPKDVSKKFGFTLCMGFIYIKHSLASQTFFNIVKKDIPKYRNDDQYAVNSVLFHKPTVEKKSDHFYINAILPDSQTIKAVGLPYSIAVRERNNELSYKNTYICHPNTKKTCLATKKKMQKLGIWRTK